MATTSTCPRSWPSARPSSPASAPLDEPPRRLEAERIRRGLAAERVRVLAVGETLVVGAERVEAALPGR